MARVLVVEDNPLNMKLAALLLQRAGHSVLCAVDAETGVLRASAEQPDLILMDVQLPGMDGRAATVLLKMDPTTTAIPVIALTAMAMTVDREACIAAGCAAYLAKPLRYQELHAAIDAILDTRQVSGVVATGRVGNLSLFRLRGDALPQVAATVALDVNVLQGLVGNDPDVILEFLTDFRTDSGKLALAMRTACAEGNAALCGKQAHKLKSLAHIVGASALSELCAELEMAGRAGRNEALTKLSPGFEREFDAVIACLDALQASSADCRGYSSSTTSLTTPSSSDTSSLSS